MVTMRTKAQQFPDTNVSHGMPQLLWNTTSRDRFIRKSKIAPIFAVIRGGSAWMGPGVLPRMRPCNGSTAACLDAPKKVSTFRNSRLESYKSHIPPLNSFPRTIYIKNDPSVQDLLN